VKIIIDTGMGARAAELYAGVLSDLAATDPETAISPVDWHAALFYVAVADISHEVALVLNRRHMDQEQRTRFDAQVNLECYRADKLIAWARKPHAEIASHASAWTEEIFGWAKDDQDFYTAFSAEIGK
jgi:hypothetical protein